MSRKNYIHTMDALIGKPLYSNAIGGLLDPNSATPDFGGSESLVAPNVFLNTTPQATTGFIPAKELTNVSVHQQAPDNSYGNISPIIGSLDIAREDGDIEGIRIYEERKKAEALRLANLSEAEKAQRLQRIELMKAKREAKKQGQIVYVAPPLVIGGGGGGALGEPNMPKPASTIDTKPSFLKKNFIPLLLVTSAIFVFIKKPIK